VEISDVTQAASGDAVWNVSSGGFNIKGATSGAVTYGAPATAGSTSLTLGVTGNGTAVPTFPAATDTVVELTQSQTLTNKTLTSPTINTPTITTPTITGLVLTGATNGNTVTLLKFLGSAGALTGNSADQTYFTYTLPANTLASNKGLRITAVSKHTTGTASTNFRLSFGGTFTTTVGAGASASAPVKAVYELFNNGATNAQTITSTVLNHAGGNLFITYDIASIDTTAGVTVNVTFNVANTDQWTPEMFFIELIQ
jgi:hypothetical protein